jgi:hypothetical protein
LATVSDGGIMKKFQYPSVNIQENEPKDPLVKIHEEEVSRKNGRAFKDIPFEWITLKGWENIFSLRDDPIGLEIDREEGIVRVRWNSTSLHTFKIMNIVLYRDVPGNWLTPKDTNCSVKAENMEPTDVFPKKIREFKFWNYQNRIFPVLDREHSGVKKFLRQLLVRYV